MTKLRASEIFSDATAGLKLIAVESVDFQHGRTTHSCHCFANLKAIAIVICCPDGNYALDTDAKQVSIDQLRLENPELDRLIKKPLPSDSGF